VLLEFFFLNGLASNEGFCRVVDAELLQSENAALQAETIRRAMRMQAALEEKDAERYRALRERCRTSTGFGGQSVPMIVQGGDAAVIATARAEAIHQLLWAFLQILYGHSQLEKNRAQADPVRLETELRDVEQRQLDAHKAGKSDLERSLIGQREALEARRANAQRMVADLDLLQAEQDRIEQKILMLLETSLSLSELQQITREGDRAAATLVATQETLRRLAADPNFEMERFSSPPLLKQ